MGMLERYKKRGGFIQLLNLLETTGPEKKEKFMKMIMEEYANWDTALRQRMLTFDKLLLWETAVLMEFLPQVPTMAIAYAMADLPAEKRVNFIKALSFGDQKKVEEILGNTKPKPVEVISAQMKIITELRNQVAIGKLKMERVDPNLAVPEDIEEQLANGQTPVSIKKERSADIDGTKDSGTKSQIIATPTSTAASNTVITPPAVSTTASNNNANAIADELIVLKKKMVILSQENSRLAKEGEEYRSKFATLKAAFQKIAA